jgi:fido (protein-threonine AMPylation protein)
MTPATSHVATALTPDQSAQVQQRAQMLCSAAPTITVEGFLWLHGAIFMGIDPNAGQLRTEEAALDGFRFARVSLIRPCLEDRFAKLVASDGYRTTDREIFYHDLAHHLSELHAIAPFSMGNLRILATHAEQLARAAGHSVRTCALEKARWDRALYDGFVHRELGAFAALLAGTTIEIAPNGKCEGICGTARLPDRFLPRGRRQFLYLATARQTLETLMPLARIEARQRLNNLGGDYVAHRELAYLDHPKGAPFQLGLLGQLGIRRFEVIAHADQTALEQVREIAYGLMIALDALPRDAIETAHQRLLRPQYSGLGSPHQERMADQFLQNSAVVNRSDPRFAAAQGLVDKAGGSIAEMRGRDTVAIHAAVEQIRLDIANRIRTGEMDIGD